MLAADNAAMAAPIEWPITVTFFEPYVEDAFLTAFKTSFWDLRGYVNQCLSNGICLSLQHICRKEAIVNLCTTRESREGG